MNNTTEQIRQQAIEHKRSVRSAILFIVGLSLLLIGFILIMRTLFMPKSQYNNNNSVHQFETDQEGQFYQNEQNTSRPIPTPELENPEE
jgi:hypothetical protein